MLTRRRRPAGGDAGFTILEILVATAILVIGLVGVLALFPAGIGVGKEVVEDSTAITLARSVADAIRSGMRNNLRVETRTGGVTFTYFIFKHDGVTPAPQNRSREDFRENYFILLPRHQPGPVPGLSEAERRKRAATGDRGKTFVYPEADDEFPNGGGDPFRADDDKDEVTPAGELIVTRTYPFGTTLPAFEADERSPRVLVDQRDEVLKQYSYAFSIRPSVWDANLDMHQGNYVPGGELFHVRVMIFRAFNDNYVAGGEPVQPVFEIDFEVAR
jgi:prepilin-type N-terminal cleavage/methylation domain-containing protein